MYRLPLASLALAAACSDHTVVVGELQEVASFKAIPNPNLDILFVVDNSGSMAEQQATLAANFPRMMDVLGQLDGGLPNLHIGVVTSDMGTSGIGGVAPAPAIGTPGGGGCAGVGDDGKLQANSPALTGTFISDVGDGTGARIRNYTGELRDVFSEIAQVGASGCGFEQHLSAMQRALGHPDNAGFVRPDANLAVIIVADEDDCSTLAPSTLFGPEDATNGPLQSYRCTRHGVVCDPDMDTPGAKANCVPREDSAVLSGVQPIVDALVAVKGDPRYVMVAGIIGDPAPVAVEPSSTGQGLQLVPSCNFDGPAGPEVADAGVRLSGFLDAFPGRSELTSICSADLSTPLVAIGGTAKKLLGDPCLDTSVLADASPDPGIQPACEVADIRDSAPDAPRFLPTCTPGATDCFELVADTAACPTSADHLRIAFRRTIVADDTWTSVRCQLR